MPGRASWPARPPPLFACTPTTAPACCPLHTLACAEHGWQHGGAAGRVRLLHCSGSRAQGPAERRGARCAPTRACWRSDASRALLNARAGAGVAGVLACCRRAALLDSTAALHRLCIAPCCCRGPAGRAAHKVAGCDRDDDPGQGRHPPSGRLRAAGAGQVREVCAPLGGALGASARRGGTTSDCTRQRSPTQRRQQHVRLTARPPACLPA